MRNYILFLLLMFSGCTSNHMEFIPEVEHELLDKPVELDKKMVERGRKIFNKTCTSCHGKDGHGIAGQGPRLNSPDFLGLANDHFIQKTIEDGRPGTAMTAYKKQRRVKKEIPNLVAYIRSWQNDYSVFKKYKVDWNKKISGDAVRGRKGFRIYCAYCHGPNGGGYADGGAGTAIGLTGFLKVASDDYIKKTIQIGRAGTAMKAFGHGRGLATLDDEEINDIVTYLRSLE